MEQEKFDFEAFKAEALRKLSAGEGLTGKSEAFTPLLKLFLEESLKGELEQHLQEKAEKYENYLQSRIPTGTLPRTRATPDSVSDNSIRFFSFLYDGLIKCHFIKKKHYIWGK